MTVPYSFGSATSAIPLSQLDSNFNTPITLGNTAIQLGNTVTTLNNMTLANVTISSGNVTLTNISATFANITTSNVTTENVSLLKLTGSSSGYVGLQGAAAAGSTTYTMPSADGTNGQALVTNGSGTLSWASAGASAATPTALGTVYGSMTTSGASPYLTALGYNAGLNNTGANNTAVGTSALQTNTSGTLNTAVGYEALLSNTTASWNTAVGNGALRTNSTGAKNTAVGRRALYSNTTGTDNAAFGTEDSGGGYGPLWSNTTGNYNTAIGNGTLGKNTTASNNTAVGYQAGYSNSLGAYNTFIGHTAGYSFAPTGAANTYNTFVGAQSGYSVTTGTSNTFMGLNAGYYVSTGTNNTILGTYNGNQDGLDIRTSSNYVVLSDGGGNRQASMAEGKSLALDSAVPQTGTGITFPATQSASTDANTLDDYEEGTWTPNQGAGLTVVGAFSSAGTYTKIGNLVYARGYVAGATSVSVTAGAVITGNLPFTNAANDSCGGNATNYQVNQTSGIYASASTTTIYATSALTASAQIIFSITYRV